MTNPKQSVYDSRRSTTLVRIGLVLLSAIRRVARQDKKTVRETMEQVLRERFPTQDKVKP